MAWQPSTTANLENTKVLRSGAPPIALGAAPGGALCEGLVVHGLADLAAVALALAAHGGARDAQELARAEVSDGEVRGEAVLVEAVATRLGLLLILQLTETDGAHVLGLGRTARLLSMRMLSGTVIAHVNPLPAAAPTTHKPYASTFWYAVLRERVRLRRRTRDSVCTSSVPTLSAAPVLVGGACLSCAGGRVRSSPGCTSQPRCPSMSLKLEQ